MLLGGHGGNGHRGRSGGGGQRSSCFAAEAVGLIQQHAHSPGIPEGFLDGPHEAVEDVDGVCRINITQMLRQEISTFLFPVSDGAARGLVHFLFNQGDRFLVDVEELWEIEKSY